MKTIERLRELLVKATGPYDNKVDPWMDQRFKARDECLVALPAILAVVEAQAAEIEAWREVDVAASAVMKIMRIHGGGALVEEMKEVAMQKKDIVRGARVATDAALRAMEGGAG